MKCPKCRYDMEKHKRLESTIWICMNADCPGSVLVAMDGDVNPKPSSPPRPDPKPFGWAPD